MGFVAKPMIATTAMTMSREMAIVLVVATMSHQPNLPHRYHPHHQQNVPMTKAFGFANANKWIVDGLENDPTSDAGESTRTNGCGSTAPLPVTNVEFVWKNKLYRS